MLGTGKSITEHPTTNTFSYNTGWGYVQYYPQSTNALTGPRAYSEATGSINGMGGSYTIFVTVDINRDLWRDFLNFPYFTGFPAP